MTPMSQFIEGYVELKMQPLVTPMGTDWYADETVLVAGVMFEKDLSSLFPYLNGVLQKAIYLKEPPFIRFRYEGVLCAVHPFYMAAFPFRDRSGAEGFADRIIEFMNDVHARRSAIRPNHKVHHPVSVVEVLKFCPKPIAAAAGILPAWRLPAPSEPAVPCPVNARS
jgi:hypothetical protein